MEPTEHQIQCSVVEYCMLKKILVFAIPNGGVRHIGTAVKLKKEGVKAGVPDLFIPMPTPDFNGLFLELKTKIGKLSAAQKTWIVVLKSQGYAVEVAHSVDEAIDAIEHYFLHK